MTINSTALLNNRYKIIKTLGQGGFGETFLAIDTHLPSKRKCVIKQLKPILHEPTIPLWMCDRFEQEARILESLGEKQEQIPQLYAYFQEGNNFFLVQEWIDGITLTEKVEKEGLLSPEQVETILKKLLPVLSYIHEQNIVHRDLKPDNIIYRQHDQSPVLIDFGAVKEAISDKDLSKSVYSIAIGTPGYMPSEQAAGRPIYSSDLYSLGLTAIYLLTGKTPQYLKTNVKTGEIMWRREIPHLHSSLTTVIDRAIRFNPRERFATAQEMLYALKGESSSSGYDSAYSQGRTKVIVGNSPRQFNSNVTSKNQTRTITSRYRDNFTRQNQTREVVVNDDNKINIPLFLPLLLLSLIAIISFLFGYQLWKIAGENREQSPEITLEQPLEELPNSDVSQEKDDKLKSSDKKNQDNSSTLPPKAKNPINSSPSPSQDTKPQPKPPEPVENLPVNTISPIGLASDELSQKWGQPSYTNLAYGDRVTVVAYNNPQPNIEQIKYLVSNQTNRVVQVEFTVSSQSKIALITNVMNQSIDGSISNQVKNAIEEVLTGKTDLRSFYVDNYQGMAQIRNRRLEIRIWDRQFSF